jgi:two-component system, chemotaxis family, CheB/CheR fusion protein
MRNEKQQSRRSWTKSSSGSESHHREKGTPTSFPALSETSQKELDDSKASPSFPIVGIGASAGGLEAFTQLLRALPLDSGMGFVLVQHLDPQHESALTQILSRATSLPVHEISDNQPVEPNCVYVIPRDTNLRIERGILKLSPRESGRTPHRPIDSFFESLAQDQRERAIGVVLSGTASDGTLGLEAIKAEGGITLAQDESAKHDSMPRSAIASGFVDLVLSPAEIAKELARIAEHPFVLGQPFQLRSETARDHAGASQAERDRAQATAHEDDDTPLPSGGHSNEQQTPATGKRQVPARAKSDEAAEGTLEESYKKILLILRNHCGVDFSLYKSTTIQRRITRRLVLGKQRTLHDYARFLKGNPKELDALYSDVLISVTSFFRNPEAFEAIQREVLPALLKRRSDEPVRCWVLGCSTGQEAYSLAMAFVEVAEKTQRTRQLQVFATDLNDALLEKARHGLYAKSLAEDISPQRLRRFFTEEEGGYRIIKSLREMVVFARQNLITDPPFSRMDLISCRNLLIYFEPSLQKKAIPTFHYALRPGGFLLLGASESIGGFTELFEPVDKKQKIYAKKTAATPAFHLPLGRTQNDPLRASGKFASRRPARVGTVERTDVLGGELSAQREADRVAVNQFAPPGVLINAENQVLQFRGATGAYLNPPSGKATFDVLKMAREGLTMPLRAAINEAAKENKTARRENVRVHRDGESGETRTINVEVIPLKNLSERCFLVVFEEPDKTRPSLLRHQPVRPVLSNAEEQSRLAELESDLSEMREYLQAMQEQYEASSEELQASNEEVQSANEELQSLNEELETSKEELESANEELSTVNDEMTNRNIELNRLNSDLINLQTSTKLAIMLVGRDLTIQRFSPQAQKLFDLLATDIGRSIGHIRRSLVVTPPAEFGLPQSELLQSGSQSLETALDVEIMVSEVIASVHEQECDVRDKRGHWYQLRVRPYMTLDNKVDGAVLVLVDIDAVKQNERIQAALSFAQATVDAVREPLLVLDGDLRVRSAGRAFYRHFRVTPEETIGRFVYELGNHQWDIPRLRTMLEDILPNQTAFDDFEVTHDFDGLGQRTMLLNARRLGDHVIRAEWILLAIDDITESRQRVKLRASEERYRTLTEQVKDYAIFRTDVQGRALTWNEGVKRILGFDEADFIGQDIVQTIFTPEDVESGVAQHELETAATEGTAGNDRWMRRKSGEPFFASGVTTALRNEKGELIGFTKVLRDMTERKESERALLEAGTTTRRLAEELEAIYDTSPVGMSQLDRELRFVRINDALAKMHGIAVADHIGRTIREVMPVIADKVEPTLRSVLETGESVVDIELSGEMPARSGAQRTWQGSCYPLRNTAGQIVGLNVLTQDITERKRLEQDLKNRNEQLAEADESKNQFIAILSHELRNPIAPISMAVNMLRHLGPPDSKVQELRNVIERQTIQLSCLLDGLLDVSRIASGKIMLHQERIDLNAAVTTAVETALPLIESQAHELVTDIPAESIIVYGDLARLAQIVANLLNNAAKYTDRGGRITLTAERAAGEGVIRVRDTGIGLAPEQASKIFEMFAQVDPALERTKGGLGVGLALTKTLVELHGGRIEVESEGLGKGSTFSVYIPLLHESLAPEGIVAPDRIEHPMRRRILIADDNEDAARVLALALREDGHEVAVTHDGQATLEASAAFNPEVAILDIGMPKMNGYEVAKQLRARFGRRLLLVAVTGWGKDEDKRRAREAGFDHHFTKPANLDVISALL